MTLLPVDREVRFRPGVPPRTGVVEFARPGAAVVELPVPAALPSLVAAGHRHDLHPSAALLADAAALGLRLVADGHLEPAPDGAATGWRVPSLPAAEAEEVARVAVRHGVGADVVHQVLDAVADTLPRGDPPPGGTAAPDFGARLRARLARLPTAPGETSAGLPHLVRLSLRVEADEEELRGGVVRLVPQVHDERDPVHLCDAALLWVADPEEQGFGHRARVHAGLALRAAADVWAPLGRLLELRVPEEITLDGDELGSLLEHGVGDLQARGVDVHWPRSLGRDLTSSVVLDLAEPAQPTPRVPGSPTPREQPLQDPLLGLQAVVGFRWQLAVNGTPLTQAELDELAGAATPLLRLRGEWTVVPPSVARRARQRLARTATPAQGLAAVLTGRTPSPGGGAAAIPDDVPVLAGAGLAAARRRLLTAATRDPIDPPPGLLATLRDYQRHGLTWLADLTALGLGGCLADDMGLGKTITVIALHLHRRALLAERGGVGATLVVCPASLLGNWEAEIRRFAPDVAVRRHHGDDRDLDPAADESALTGFVLTTYGTMRNDARRLAAVGFDLVVADEAQHVKNPATAAARRLRTIPSRARVALTGTPVENELTELWAILDWAVPGLLGSRNAFRKTWAQPVEAGVDPEITRRFAGLVQPFLLRRRKSDPGIAPELPPKTVTDHHLLLTREQVVLYEAFVRRTMDRIATADPQARRGLVLALLTGCKQICNHPAQFLKQSGAVRLAGRSQKLDLLEELLGTVLAEGGAALVFTQYVALARLVQGHLAARGVSAELLHGGTPVRQRETMVARFQAGEAPVLLLSLKAGGTGLNLTRADHVVHLDRWWNPAVEDQATDRAHRIGQTRPVQVHTMTVRGTVEERIAALLARKSDLAEAVLGRGERALTELDDAELRALVELGTDHLSLHADRHRRGRA